MAEMQRQSEGLRELAERSQDIDKEWESLRGRSNLCQGQHAEPGRSIQPLLGEAIHHQAWNQQREWYIAC